MKTLIYGGRGWIGSQFCSLLDTFILGEARVDDLLSLKNEINRVNPSHIVSFIGRTHGKIDDKTYSTIDYLEQPGKLKENIRDNLFCPISLALLCKERDIHLTYLGTGCIFKFDEEHPWVKKKMDLQKKVFQTSLVLDIPLQKVLQIDL